jgi:hypothetical protein
LYPYLYDDDVLEFRDMGIVEIDNVKIQWPESRIRKGAPPIADIQLDDICGEKFILVHNNAVHKATYKAGYVVLEKNTHYKVIAVAMDRFRGKAYIFATLSSGIKVRCGKSLENKINTWLEEYPDDEAPYMSFTTMECKTVQGFKDILVR